MREELERAFSDWDIHICPSHVDFDKVDWQSEKRLLFFDTLPSTRAYVKDLAPQLLGPVDELVVVAQKQTAGQGRMDRTWYAEPGAALTFNYVTKLNESVVPGHLSLLAAWAQYKVFYDLYGVRELDLKWPNDVWLKGRKVSGSLMELVQHEGAEWVSLGLGVNVGSMDFPEEIADQSIALADVLKDPVSATRVLSDIVECFRLGLNRLREPEWLIEEYTEASSFVRGAFLEYEESGEIKIAQSAGLSESGGLMLIDNSGIKREWHGSEIQKVRKR